MEEEEREFLPDWVSPPGDSIERLLEERKISISEFAQKIDKPISFVENLLIGEEFIDVDLASKLEAIIGSTAAFWLRREENYRKDKIRLNK